MQRAPFRSISRWFEYLQNDYESMQGGSSRVKLPQVWYTCVAQPASDSK